ncbi:MAG: hypothetical protein HYR62_09335 [Actinobacteria bacterium]|nr:hypothetical protein [Actinomycetota bacterium]MBI3688041.1 hypothetical protein [Actinomycetota bacterium]
MASGTGEIRALLCAAVSAMEKVVSDPAMGEEVRRMVGAVADLAVQVRVLLAEVERLDVPPGSCSMGWGVCPEHGRTLMTSRGRSHCTVCDASWGYDRENQHCREPAAFRFNLVPICRAHAVSAPFRAQLVPIQQPD